MEFHKMLDIARTEGIYAMQKATLDDFAEKDYSQDIADAEAWHKEFIGRHGDKFWAKDILARHPNVKSAYLDNPEKRLNFLRKLNKELGKGLSDARYYAETHTGLLGRR